MSIIRQLSETEADQIWLESLILRKAEAMHHFASVSKAVNSEFWALETSRLINLLNSDIPRSLAIMQNDFAVNGPVNAGLDLINLPRFSSRAPVTADRADIVFDGSQFVYVPPQEPEPPAE